MTNTSTSLLARLRDSGDSQAWERLNEIYGPLLQSWLARQGVQPADADDVVQEVLSYVAESLPRFEHNGRPGAFRGWLRQVMAYRLQRFWQTRDRQPTATGDARFLQQARQLEDPHSGVSRIWEREHDRYLARRLLELARPHFQETTWTAFQRTVLEGQKPREAAQELGLSVNAVFIAKSRVLRHLREAGWDLIE